MAHPQQQQQQQQVREWPTSLFNPSVSCLLACLGCGCIPLYAILRETAPLRVLGCLVPKSRCCAALLALVLWFGTVHAVGQTAGLLLLAGWIVLSIGVKSHLGIDENDLVTAAKAFLCPPCHVGQIYDAVREYGGLPPGGAMHHPLKPEAPSVPAMERMC